MNKTVINCYGAIIRLLPTMSYFDSCLHTFTGVKLWARAAFKRETWYLCNSDLTRQKERAVGLLQLAVWLCSYMILIAFL